VVQNKGTAPAGAFHVQWWASEKDRSPAKTWKVNSLPPRGSNVLSFKYKGFSSQSRGLYTKTVVDNERKVKEADERDFAIMGPPEVPDPALPEVLSGDTEPAVEEEESNCPGVPWDIPPG
jgi:hypothetical protein